MTCKKFPNWPKDSAIIERQHINNSYWLFNNGDYQKMEGVNDGNIKLTPIMQLLYTPYCGDYWLAYIYHVICGLKCELSDYNNFWSNDPSYNLSGYLININILLLDKVEVEEGSTEAVPKGRQIAISRLSGFDLKIN